jgi:phosphoribosylformylglycinamidine synthase
MATVYGTPFVSGKDSLYNEFEYEGKLISIPHTLLVSALGVMDNVTRAVSMDFKQAGDSIYAVGETKNELGGSAYFNTRSYIGNHVPTVDPVKAKATMEKLSRATAKGLVRACHDCSEGGVGVAVAEMAFAGGLGAKIALKSVPLSDRITRDDYILFSESNSRFIVEIAPENKTAFEKIIRGTVFAEIGKVTQANRFEVVGVKGVKVLSEKIADLKEAWQKPLRW